MSLIVGKGAMLSAGYRMPTNRLLQSISGNANNTENAGSVTRNYLVNDVGFAGLYAQGSGRAPIFRQMRGFNSRLSAQVSSFTYPGDGIAINYLTVAPNGDMVTCDANRIIRVHVGTTSSIRTSWQVPWPSPVSMTVFNGDLIVVCLGDSASNRGLLIYSGLTSSLKRQMLLDVRSYRGLATDGINMLFSDSSNNSIRVIDGNDFYNNGAVTNKRIIPATRSGAFLSVCRDNSMLGPAPVVSDFSGGDTIDVLARG